MTSGEFAKAWPVLKRQVKSLDVPWLDALAASERDPFKILISCILSLRTQDKTTEEASGRLFALASTPDAVGALSEEVIEKAIYPVGFYRVKTRTIKKICSVLLERYGSKVPDTIEELLTLEGVGRKTANLVVTLGYNRPGICVDTHVHRITNRWRLVSTANPTETEFALRKVLPQKYWIELNGILVAFGQRICKPLSPLCSRCAIQRFCPRVQVARSR
ncbi:MAG: endonuclease III [Nitrospirales bacterium]|nr:endonuclease III [Nitrospirales bacterium]